MLILTRRAEETICIGDEVRITVLGIKGNQVRIGVNAPREVPVHREEIYKRIQENESDENSGKPIQKATVAKLEACQPTLIQQG